jgi:glycosyltransferase involved in cell wall biosynthesis
VRIINHPVNLGEMGNMNALLSEARGQYFSWLADDDLYATGMLSTVARAIDRFDHPACVLTTYSVVASDAVVGKVDPVQLNPAEFLQRYLRRSLPVLGCYGFYRREQLLALGGMTRLSPGLSPYSDNLLALKAALLRPVVIERPLIYFRTHDQSLSFTSVDVAAYRAAQQALWALFNRELLPRVELADESRDAIRTDLLNWCVRDFYGVVGRSGRWQDGELRSYALFLRTAYLDFDRYPWGVATTASRERLKLPLRILLQKWRRKSRGAT